MVTKEHFLELLAPAGDPESLRAAVAAGADAVYLGGKLFNARRSATNFDRDQLQAAVELLHLHKRKIYVTVNTLIQDSELSQALEYLAELYNLGVDAVIIQDLGLVKLARRYLPGLALHASTQMTVHNSEGALFLKNLGLKRIVLARELTRDEVAAIVNTAAIEVEVFLHGALCVCYSGQCLFSSMIGGRSGNRGRCAQPCRMEYRLIRDGRPLKTSGNYLLSPKDLALITLIPELDQAGVTALKIEGRMKGPEYVFSVVKTYRRALDDYYRAPGQFQVEPAVLRELETSFNRGFTTGYFGNNRNAALMSFNRPNNRGVFLGRVLKTDPEQDRVTLKLEADLESGDVVEIWVSRGGRGAVTVAEIYCNGRPVRSARAGMTVSLPVQERAYPGDRVFKVFSNQLEQQTREALARDNPALKLSCDVTVRGTAGQPLEVTYRDGTGHSGTATTDVCLGNAKNKPLTVDILKEHLGRLGNTPYYLQQLTMELAPGLMIPLSELNQVRRTALARLREQQLAPYQRQPVRLPSLALPQLPAGERRPGGKQGQPVLSVWVGDLESVKAAVRAGAALVYAGGDELTGFHWNEPQFREALAFTRAAGARLILAMPRINREAQRQLWLDYYRLITAVVPDGVMVSDLGLLHLVINDNWQSIFLNYPLNFYNSWALQAVAQPRIEQIAVSPELTLKQIAGLRPTVTETRLEAVVQGPVELMVSEYCPINSLITTEAPCPKTCRTGSFALRDRKNLDFPVYTDQFCRMHLLNSKDHCLYSELAKLIRSGLDVLRLELKIYPAEKVELITRTYQKALDSLTMGNLPEDADKVIAEFKAQTGRGITKGHYFRGVD